MSQEILMVVDAVSNEKGVEPEVIFFPGLKHRDSAWRRGEFVIRGEGRDDDMNVQRVAMDDRLDRFGCAVGDEDPAWGDADRR